MWNLFRNNTPKIAEMTEREKEIIRSFANGSDVLRSSAIEIHRYYIPTLGVRGTDEQRFMAEIDNPCPDFGLRAQYRKVLLDN